MKIDPLRLPGSPDLIELELGLVVAEQRSMRAAMFGFYEPPERTREERLLGDRRAGGGRREKALRELGQ